MDIPRRSKISRQSKSFARTRRTRIFVICGLFILIVIIFLFGVSRIINLNVFHIDSVNIFGADQDILPTLNAAADKALEGSYLGLFSRRSLLVYPRGSLIESIVSASPRISQVTVRRDGWHSLIVSVNEKVPVALVCPTLPDWNGNVLSTDTSDACYFADETGYLFEQSPSFSGHLYNRYYVPDLLDTSITADSGIGHVATSTSEFTSLQRFYAAVRAAGIDAQALLVKPGGEYELYANQKVTKTGASLADDTLVIYFNNLRSFDIQLSNLVSFWNQAPTASASSKKEMSSRFEYLDIRYGSNVFYRALK